MKSTAVLSSSDAALMIVSTFGPPRPNLGGEGAVDMHLSKKKSTNNNCSFQLTVCTSWSVFNVAG